MQILCKVLTAGIYSFKHLEGNQNGVLAKVSEVKKEKMFDIDVDVGSTKSIFKMRGISS